MQSYQNVSNSQLAFSSTTLHPCCKRLCKVIKMLAIHNQGNVFIATRLVANAYAKLSKCQQLTTYYLFLLLYRKLQTLMQSYQNVSNSQHNAFSLSEFKSCKRLCKVIKMLAIHNNTALRKNSKKVANAYAKLSKCQQFTTMAVHNS